MILQDTIGFYTFRQVCKMTGLSRRTIYRYLKKKLFPPPAHSPTGRNMWWIPDVHSWIRARREP